MIKINAAIITKINEAKKAADLVEFVQKAIELEHSTIPPYLTAEYSIKPGTNVQIETTIHEIVLQEMLHFLIAGNIMIALGGKPRIFDKNFSLNYPSNLPMNIGGDSLKVGLECYSPAQVQKVFLEIEEPENPLKPSELSLVKKDQPSFATIGEFYRAIQKKISELPDDELPGNPELQVISDFFDEEVLFPIKTKENAIKAIDVIVEQGEGTDKSPVDMNGQFAHYYRFLGFLKGKEPKLDASPEGFSYTGNPIPFDVNGIIQLEPNTKAKDLPADSEQRKLADKFNTIFTDMLKKLDEAFNGSPVEIRIAIKLMRNLDNAARELVKQPYPNKNTMVGPPFEFVAS